MTDDRKLDREPLPFLPLRQGVILPGRVTTVPVGRARSRALAQSLSTGDLVVLGVQRDPAVEDPALVDVHEIATVARVRDKTDRGRRGVFLLVEAEARVRLDALVATTPFWQVRTSPVLETGDSESEAAALLESMSGHLAELVENDGALTEILDSDLSPGRFADRVATWIDAPSEEKVEVLLALDIVARLRAVAEMLRTAKTRAELRHRIETEVKRDLTKDQRDAMLRKQLRAIQKELGEGSHDAGGTLRDKLDALTLPEDVRKLVDRELGRLESAGGQGAEANVIRNHLELIADLPWTTRAEASQDIEAVARVLDEDHFGLEDVKRRVLEHMAVLKLSAEARGTILCLVGPPGVGKTSLAQSVARATDRPLARVSLGGVRDEAEIRGHRRTYVGALPGRILAALRKVGVKNPVIVLDEIDKLARGYSGDPEAALLEVLDPEQNDSFTDHYLEAPFDLSEVLFIATANDLTTISPPLRDRLEIIEVTGYTTEEKVRIAHDHLLPKQLERHGLTEDVLKVSDDVLATIIRDYTREAGVRKLDQQIARLCRNAALEVAKKHDAEVVVRIADEDLDRILGRRRFTNETAERTEMPGVAAGLAWTPVGGDILYIETTKMPGKGKLEITGQLGEVMSESARAALAYVRSRASELGIDPSFLDATDLHLHVPAGAVPKDGPSAGVTIFTALTSLLTGRRVRGDTAMTGEATLRGRVLPVGGIKSKVLAAHRAGFTRVILPKKNEHDYGEVPEAVRAELEVFFVEDMRDVLAAALEPIGGAEAATPTSAGDDATVIRAA